MSLNTVSALWQRTKKGLFIALLFAVRLSGLFSTWGMLSYPWVMSTSNSPEQIILIAHNLFISFESARFHRHCLGAIRNYVYIFPFMTYHSGIQNNSLTCGTGRQYSQVGNSDGGEVWFTLEKGRHLKTSSYGYWIMHFLSHFNRKSYTVMYI